jgi:hypothetical protein
MKSGNRQRNTGTIDTKLDIKWGGSQQSEPLLRVNQQQGR